MPVEIRQIIIRALVQNESDGSSNQGVGPTPLEGEVENILKIIEKQKER